MCNRAYWSSRKSWLPRSTRGHWGRWPLSALRLTCCRAFTRHDLVAGWQIVDQVKKFLPTASGHFQTRSVLEMDSLVRFACGTCLPCPNELHCRTQQHTTKCRNAPRQASASLVSAVNDVRRRSDLNLSAFVKRRSDKGQADAVTLQNIQAKLTCMPARLKFILQTIATTSAEDLEKVE